MIGKKVTFKLRMVQENKKDNTLIIALIIISVVALLGAAAWYWQNQKTSEKGTTPLGTGSTSSGTAPSTPAVTFTWEVPKITSEDISAVLPSGSAEFEFGGVSKDGKYVRYRGIQINDPTSLIDGYQNQLTQAGWKAGEITDNRDGVQEFGTTFRWWRIKTSKDGRELVLTVDLDTNRVHVVEYEVNAKAQIVYPSDFPDELKTEDKPEWVLLGTDWLGKQMVVVDFASLPSEFTREYFTAQEWMVGGVGVAPGVVGNAFGKGGMELYVGSCSESLPACLNKVRVTLRAL